MKKKPKKKYLPGELEKIRKQLGEISDEEAKKMAEILGGEVGIELDEEEIEKKYRKLKFLEERKKRLHDFDKTKALLKEKNEQTVGPSVGSQAVTEQNQKKIKKKKLSYMNRLRLDYLSSKPEFGIKSVSGVLAAFFSFLVDAPDYLNPVFLKNANDLFFLPLNSFVNAVRSLYSKNKKEIYKEISKNTFYSKILSVIKMWDIESMNRELSAFQKNPYNQEIKRFEALCKKIYYPFGVFYYLTPEAHIRRAIKWAYDKNLAFGPEENQFVWKQTMKMYETANELLPVVFTDIKRLFYPLMLKFTSDKFYFYEEYITRERDAIFKYLKITHDNIIFAGEEKTAIMRIDTQSTGPQPDEQPEDEEEQGEVRDAPDRIGTAHPAASSIADFNKGAAVLIRLFPKIAWNELDSYPDLYPYFRTIFDFPTGFELIPRSDPLQQVIVLCTIINNIFYGFRHIEFGNIRDKSLGIVQCREKIEVLLAQWPSFLEEIIFKNYVVRLRDFCRNIEKDKSFIKSELWLKMTNELEAIKKECLFPHLEFRLTSTSAIKMNYLRFHEVVKDTRILLFKIKEDLSPGTGEESEIIIAENQSRTKRECESVRNSSKIWEFDLDNPVSKRLGKIFITKKRYQGVEFGTTDKRTNSNLIVVCYTLVSMLDFLLNSVKSYFYKPGKIPLFRSVNDDGETPQYFVAVEENIPDAGRETGGIPDADNNLTSIDSSNHETESYAGHEFVSDILDRHIAEYRLQGSPFSIMYVNVTTARRTDPLSKTYPFELERVIKMSIRPVLDIIFRTGDTEYLILSKNTNLNFAITSGKKILEELKGRKEYPISQYSPAAGVFQFKKEWNLETLLQIIEKTKITVRKQSALKIIFLDNETHVFKVLSS
jgi:hypothetical protein